MQDSSINYNLSVTGAEQAVSRLQMVGAAALKATSTVNNTAKAADNNASSMNNMAGGTDRAAKATERASKSQASYFGHIAKTTVQSALINKLFLELVDVSGQAVQQVDLMNNFPATMASLGQSTQQSNEAFQALRDYVGQVGGNLGDATSAVTRFTGVTKDVKSAVAIFTGLNNALVAGDSSMEEQRMAAIQFAQAFERGKPDMKEWLSLTQNMSNQLGMVAKEMGYVNATALGEALRSGEEDMGAFTTTLVELSTGTGPIAQQAMARMNGMQFAFNVMKNTMVQGLAAIINAFGRTNIVSFFTFLTQVIQLVAERVVWLIQAFFALINVIRGLFGLSPLEGMKKDAEGVAGGLKGAGNGAEELGEGLKGAKKDAKELNKSLASFDKMNVLPDKTSGKDKDDEGAGGGTNFDAAQMAALGDAFGNIGKKIGEASLAAKIFAGILAGIAALRLGYKAVEGLNNMIDTMKTAKKNVDDLNTKLTNMGNNAKTQFGKVGEGMKNSPLGKGASALTSTIAGFVGGIAGAIGAALGPALTGVFSGIIGAIGGVLAAGAAALGVSVGVFVLIIAAVIAVIVGLIWLIATNWDSIVKFMTDVWNGFVGWLTDIWNTLYAIFEGPVKFIYEFVRAVFILIVALIAMAIEGIFKLFVWMVDGIFNLLGTVGGWIWDNVIVPVATFFKDLWEGIVSVVRFAFETIFSMVLAPVAMWIFNNVIAPIGNFFKGLWEGAVKLVRDFVNGFYPVIRPIVDWMNNNIVKPISGFFSWLWNNITQGLSNLMNGLGRIFGSIGDIMKAPINGVIDLINRVLGSMSNIKVPDWVPGLGGSKVNFPKIPRLARGGIVEQATLAMIGEDGKEAVVPLENNTEWLDALAEKINGAGGANSQPVQLTVQIGEERIVTKVIELINERTQMSGRNKIVL